MRIGARGILAVGLFVAGFAGVALIGTHILDKRALAVPRPLLLDAAALRPATHLVIGDSRIAQWPTTDLPLDTVRLGFPGETATSIARAVAPACRAVRPKVIVLQAGFNDASAATFHFGAERDRIVERAVNAIANMTAEAQRCGAKFVLVMTVVPEIAPAWPRRLVHGGRHDAAIATINQAIAKMQGPKVYIFDTLQALRGGCSAMPSSFRADAAHWTSAAYRRLGLALSEALTSSRKSPALAREATNCA